MQKDKLKRLCAAAGMLSLLLCGCQEAVDYDLSTQNATQEGTSPLGLESRGKWEEDFLVAGENGNKVVTINSYISIPDAEQMSVVELQEIPFDEKYKKQLIEQLYGTLEVYSEDEEDKPKDYWVSYIQSLEKNIQYMEEKLSLAKEEEWWDVEHYESYIQVIQDEITRCKEYMSQAPEEALIVEDFTGESYSGTYLSSNYKLSFIENSIYFAPEEEKKISPEKLQSEHVYHVSVDFDTYNSENICSISMEDAKTQAEAMLRLIGWTEPVQGETKVLQWNGSEKEESCIDGYSFEFYQGADGIAFGKFDGGYKRKDENGLTEYARKATVEVNEKGIIAFSADTPVCFLQVTEDVDLLSLETIKGIIKNELNKNLETYLSGQDTVSFREMELNYIPVKDKEQTGYYSYVPAWRLCTSMNGQNGSVSTDVPVLVNAIDGSIIYLEDIMEFTDLEEDLME